MKRVYIIASAILILASCNRESLREITDFNNDWEFARTGGIDDSLAWQAVDLPHDWSIEGPFDKDNPATPGGGALPGGKGIYRKIFILGSETQGKLVFLEFDGIYRDSRVFVNGRLAGYRPCGYASFSYEITPLLNPPGEENTVEVTVDNSLQPNSRWYTGSGIYRKVRLVITPLVHIPYSGTYVTTPQVSADLAQVQVSTTISYPSAASGHFYLLTKILDPAGHTVAKECNYVEPSQTGEITMNQTLAVKKPALWDVTDPRLYTVESLLLKSGAVIDDYKTTIGIRTFRFTADSGFFLNERPLKIRGVCMHHDLGALGAAVNRRAIERQLEMLAQMGCNAIRTSHNPPAPELLDLCDRMGFLVMNEAFDVWRKSKSAYDYAMFFEEWHEKDLKDFILRDRNHPSVIMWSIGNEVLEQWNNPRADTLDLQQANLLLNFMAGNDSRLEGDLTFDALLTRKLAIMVKELDPTRPVTAGCNEPGVYNNLFRAEVLDIIGFNYHESDYPQVPVNFSGKPFVAAETTSSLHTRGFYQMPSDSVRMEPKQWWLTYDTPHHMCSSYDNMHAPWGNTHESAWRHVRDNEFISGMFIWTGFDYLGEPTPYWWPARSSYFGIIDLAGFPKDVYYMYQSEWTDTSVLHLFPHWNWKQGETVDVWAYYNRADSVELFLNERSLGVCTKDSVQLHACWRVPYEPGTLTAVSYYQGKEFLRRSVSTAGVPARLKLTPDRSILDAGGDDLVFVTVEVLDENGNLVPDADDLITFRLEGPGTIAAVDNGSPISHESFRANFRKAFHGKCLVVIRSGNTAGAIRLTALSESFTQESTLDLEARLVQ
ncbi:MAG: glycoside hydrolase family 2 TIM barrel-domain containing protein [Bacteroidales bacterium]|jgi:beta-galactosidase|nr:glycoside hydrolase family 2 TIM barrel-domain containing protein [Bacteroidales bacterium]